MNDVVISKLNGGLGRRLPNEDKYSGLVAGGIEVNGGVQFNTVYRLKGISDATSIGIDEDYDSDNSILVHEHIKEFFRVNPDGDLFFMLVDRATDFEHLVLLAGSPSLDLLKACEGKIRQLGVAYNPTSQVSDFSDTEAAILAAQELAASEYANHRPVFIVLEGKGYDPSTFPPFNFRAQNSEYVAVMCGQSLAVYNADIQYETYAAVGTMLGAVSRASVNQKISWVERFNVYGGNLTVAAIAGTKVSECTEGLLQSLEEAGTVFFRTHVGKEGIYFNNSHACTGVTSDYAYIENTRTINKAVRLIREVFLPRLDSPVLIDQKTGQLSPEVVKSWESDGRRALEQMLRNDEISSLDVYVDPEQDILATGELQVSFWVVPTGSASKISVSIGFTNPF